MKPKKRQKLCANCDGDIDLDVIVCPFCAADLREVKPEQQVKSPPFMARPLGSQANPPFAALASMEETLPSAVPETPSSEHTAWRIAGSILLFALGVQIFLMGAILLLFSQNGILMLKWDARLWFLYFFASVPFLVFGYRTLSR